MRPAGLFTRTGRTESVSSARADGTIDTHVHGILAGDSDQWDARLALVIDQVMAVAEG